MAQIAKMEAQVEMKSPANKFYEVLSSKAHLLPKACPDKIKSIEVVEDDWKSVGCVELWTYCIGKLEIETEIKAPADEFFKIFRSQAHHLPNICSDKIHKIEVHEGDWETQGSVKHWSYTIGGNSKSIKETVESIDEENRSITFKVLDGELLNDYKSYKFTTQAIPKGEGCLVKWTAEYEKASEDGSDPRGYLELAVNITKDVESHLLNA